jgi:hypothetical protein
MARIPPLQITVYDKNFVRRGRIGNPQFVTVTQRYNKAGLATIGVPATHRLVPELFSPGARLHIADENGAFVMSGYVDRIRGKGPSKQALFEVDIDDDFRVLQDVLGWVLPSAAITDQGTGSDDWTMTGPAESVLKAAVQANAVGRLAMPLTCATDQGRGATVTANLRFHPLYDRLFPVVDGAGVEAAGIGVTVAQVGDHLVLDVFEPAVYPRDLTETSGVITEWNYTYQAPTATRVAVGGSGEAQLRSFRTVADTAREAASGRIIERFRDARDVAQDDPNMVPLLYARGQETLDEGAEAVGLSVTLSQTANFRYLTSVRVGDQVTMRVAGSLVITDRLSEATLSWTYDDGWKATPRVGQRADEHDGGLARGLRTLARTLANQNRT